MAALILMLCIVPITFAEENAIELAQFFNARRGCFVLYDSRAQRYVRYNRDECSQRFSPCSTFKIPHSVIALHTGVASGPEFIIKWDGIVRGNAAWDRDLTLRSAFRDSAVWYFQELARRIGPEREAQIVQNLQYGNNDTSGGLTNFWLESSLLISADEQVEFLRRLWANDLPVSRQAQELTRKIMELERHDGKVLYGKTGTGGDADAGVARLGWFIGIVESETTTAFFATRINGERDASGRQARRISEDILQRLGYWKKE